MVDVAHEERLGGWMLTSLVIGSMIGAGIFMLPVALAPYGANAIIAWFISCAGTLCMAFALAKLVNANCGGIQAYIEDHTDRTTAFVVTWATWCGYWSANAALAITTAAALSNVHPALNHEAMIVPAAAGSLVILTIVNAMGARSAGGLNIITVILKILPLLAAILILAIDFGTGTELEPLSEMPVNPGNIAGAVSLTLFALLGFEVALLPVGKIRDPERLLPRAIVGGILFVAALYILASTAILLILPAESVAASTAPFADAVSMRWGEGAASLVALGMAISAFGCANAGVLGSGELAFSMAQRGDMPKWLGATRGTAKTPVNAQILSSALAILLVLANASKTTAEIFQFVILLTISAMLVLYTVGTFCAVKAKLKTWVRGIAVVGLVYALVAFYGSGFEANAWLVVLLGIGLAVRTAVKRISAPAVTAA